jgi:aminoglycoside phosphotransferase
VAVTALAPDPAVPHRDALLRGEPLARLVGLSGASAECVYAKYRVGESLRVVHQFAGRHVSARTFADTRAAYEQALDAAVPTDPLPPVVHAPELGAVAWTFPNDRKLRSLGLLRPSSPELARLLGRRCRAVRLVSYESERSATAGCLDEEGRVLAYVKVHAAGGADRERRRLEAAAHAVRVPRVVAAAPAYGALVLEPLAGRRADTVPARELRAAVARLGEALAALHAGAQRPDAPFLRLRPERLARAVALIARARPDAGGPAAVVLAALLTSPEAGAGPRVCLHGDANLRNVILARDGAALLDLEEAAAGPAAADLGQVFAGFLAARVLGRLSEGEEHALGAALLDGYARAAPPPDELALRWHTAASVLARVALPAVNRLRGDVLERLVPLLDAAGERAR